jgi:hypothetical protein
MARYRITDKETGRTAIVSGDAPPTDEDVAALFAAAPQERDRATVPPPLAELPPPKQRPSVMDYANELSGALARPLASMVDMAISPALAGYEAVTGKRAGGATSLVTPRGAFTGDDKLGQAIAVGGELATSSITVGQAGRSFVSSFMDEAARYGESAFRGVLRQLGSSAPADDVIAGFISGTSSELAAGKAEELGMSPEAVESIRALTGVGAPVATAPVLNRLNNRIGAFLRKPGATPTVEEIRGASRAIYSQIDDLGIVFNEASTRRLASDIDDLVVQESLTNLRGESTLAAQVMKVKRILEADGEFTGTTFSVLDKARAAFNDIAANKTGNEWRLAGLFRDKVDDFLMNASVDDMVPLAAASNRIGLPAPAGAASAGLSLEDSNALSSAMYNARALWKRAKTSEMVNGAFKDAELAALGGQGQPYEKVLIENLRGLLRNESTAAQFSKQETAMIKGVIQGGSPRRVLEALNTLGIKSDTFIKASMLGAAGAAYAGYMTPQSTVVAGGLAATSGVAKLAGVIASNFLRTDANTMRAMVAAGPNARALARIYLARTPTNKRDPVEFAAILKNAGVDLSTLEGKQALPSAFVADSVAFARGMEQLETSLNDVSEGINEVQSVLIPGSSQRKQ